MWIKDIRDYIIYEDKDILVCHKPAGIAVQNARVGSMDLESLLKNYIAKDGKIKAHVQAADANEDHYMPVFTVSGGEEND